VEDGGGVAAAFCVSVQVKRGGGKNPGIKQHGDGMVEGPEGENRRVRHT